MAMKLHAINEDLLNQDLTPHGGEWVCVYGKLLNSLPFQPFDVKSTGLDHHKDLDDALDEKSMEQPQ